MGIDNLLGFLKPVMKKSHIGEFRNKTAAVDAMGWVY